MVWLHNSYMELARRRPHDSMGNPNLLSYQDILTYAHHMLELDPVVIPTFVRVMSTVDEEVLADYYAKRRQTEDAK